MSSRLKKIQSADTKLDCCIELDIIDFVKI